MKTITVVILFCAVITCCCLPANAQQAFNPEYLGNAAGTGKSGFALKTFLSYFYQNAIDAHDIEMALEPQGWFPGFSGDPQHDQLQVIAHMPFGYRVQDTGAGTRGSVVGIGSLTVNVEHFWHLIDETDLEMWLDHALTASFPTTTDRELVRIGSNAYTAGMFQEMFIRYRRFIASVMPLMVTWTTNDEKTNVRSGLTLGILNSSVGYQAFDRVALGLSCGLALGNVAGTADLNGAGLPLAVRAYAGPAISVSFPHDISLQASGIIDVYTRDVARGQGVFMALWHFF